MASERILVVGTMSKGHTQLRVAPLTEDNRLLSAIEMGRYLFESGACRSACLNQDEEAGWNEAAELEAYIDDIEDRNIWRNGQW